jgi:hypothetical protein
LGRCWASLVSIDNHTRDGSWRPEAERLLLATEKARAANNAALWRDVIAVEAFQGRETKIVEMYDYSRGVTIDYLRRALARPGYLSAETLRSDFLYRDPGDHGVGLPRETERRQRNDHTGTHPPQSVPRSALGRRADPDDGDQNQPHR